MSKLGYFLAGALTGVLGLIGAGMLHDHLTAGSSAGVDADDLEAENAHAASMDEETRHAEAVHAEAVAEDAATQTA